jgi:butyryl-CoA dehydrogenase/short/branched chain acyl-CoA dehydrogenase
MQLSEEVRMLRDMVDEFGKKEVLNDGYSKWEPKGEFPKDFVAKADGLGTMGLTFPEEYEGSAMSTIAASVVAERKAFYLPSWHLRWTASHGLAGYPIMTFGTETQKERLLPALANGEILGCYALSEANAGSDAAAIQTRAEFNKKRGGWILNGAKLWITNADEASVCVLFARVKGARSVKRHSGIAAFILESDEPGLKIPGVTVNVIPKRALRCSHFAEIVLDNVFVPKDDNVLGGDDGLARGFNMALETLNNGRINIAAQSVGLARRALHEAKEYGKARKAFDKRLIDMDVRATKLARLEAEADAAWELTLHASERKDLGKVYLYDASKAKLVASEVALQCAIENFRVAGAMGIMEESIAIPIINDALAMVTYEGTSSIQELTIAKSFRD